MGGGGRAAIAAESEVSVSGYGSNHPEGDLADAVIAVIRDVDIATAIQRHADRLRQAWNPEGIRAVRRRVPHDDGTGAGIGDINIPRNIRVGDTIHLILNNRRQSLTVVGTAIGCEYVHSLGPGAIIPDPKSHGVFWVKTSFAEDAFDMQGACNQIVGLLSPDQRERPDDVLNQLERVLEPYGVATTTPREPVE